MSRFEINENSEKRFYNGRINFIIRLYFYIQEGAAQFRDLKNVAIVLLPFAAYLGITETNLLSWKIVLIGLSFLPALMLIGYLWVHRGKKSTEYFVMRFTSPYGKYQIELQEEQMKILNEINQGLKDLLNKK